MTLKWLRIGGHQYNIPKRVHDDDAGWDLRWIPADGKSEKILYPGVPERLPVGFAALNIPRGFAGILLDRSSMAGVGLHICGGLIDSGYTGEISMIMVNLSNERLALESGQRIGQMIVVPCLRWESEEALEADVPTSARGACGFGSTGHE